MLRDLLNLASVFKDAYNYDWRDKNLPDKIDTKEELFDFLKSRAEIGFKRRAISDDLIKTISEIVYEKGDIKYGLHLLWEAGMIADDMKLRSISSECLWLADPDSVQKYEPMQVYKSIEGFSRDHEGLKFICFYNAEHANCALFDKYPIYKELHENLYDYKNLTITEKLYIACEDKWPDGQRVRHRVITAFRFTPSIQPPEKGDLIDFELKLENEINEVINHIVKDTYLITEYKPHDYDRLLRIESNFGGKYTLMKFIGNKKPDFKILNGPSKPKSISMTEFKGTSHNHDGLTFFCSYEIIQIKEKPIVQVNCNLYNKYPVYENQRTYQHNFKNLKITHIGTINYDKDGFGIDAIMEFRFNSNLEPPKKGEVSEFKRRLEEEIDDIINHLAKDTFIATNISEPRGSL